MHLGVETFLSGKNPAPEGTGIKTESRKDIFLGWLKPFRFFDVFLYFSACLAHLILFFLQCRIWRLPLIAYRSVFTAILPEISLLFYSDTPFPFSWSRQARSYGFVCRPMYVSSAYPNGMVLLKEHLL